MGLSFASPHGALVALVMLLPLAGALVAERRVARIRAALRLHAPRRRLPRPWAAALAALFGLAGLAAAQPVLALEGRTEGRADAEAFVVVDVSRSMLASPAADVPTRFDRAGEAARRIRAALPDVPTGVATLTDRVLPHLFPTLDAGAFALVVEEALAVDSPPPHGEGRLGTDLAALGALAEHNFFSAGTAHRLAVVLTDGESRRFEHAALARTLSDAGVALVVVGLWAADERIHRLGDGGYVPDAAARRDVEALAGATAGRRVFAEAELPRAAAAAREALGHGPLVRVERSRRSTPLAPYVLCVAAVPLALLLARRGGPVG